MEKTDQLQSLLSRAERLFAKESYPAAKKEFERVLAAAPEVAGGGDIGEKLRICEEQIALERRRERIKKARNLEKKGDLPAALDCYAEAFDTLPESWLGDRIARLRRRMEAGQAAQAVEKAENEDDPEKRLLAYDRALARQPDPAVLEKKLGCLVELGRHDEAAALYHGDASPPSAQGRCDLGHALVAQGKYWEGLRQWEPLLPDYPALFPRVITTLPYLVRELAERGSGYALPRRALAVITTTDRELPAPEGATLEHYARYFDYRHLEELWRAGEPAAVREMLPSPPRLSDVPLLARVYLGLAESDIGYLEPAITYCLTVIYHPDTTQAPRDSQGGQSRVSGDTTGGMTTADTPREALLALLQEQVAAHAKSGRLPPALVAHWKSEQWAIAHLAALFAESEPEPEPDDRLEYFPCTPAFAREFDLSGQVLRRLREKKGGQSPDDRDLLDLHAAYLPLGQHMAWIEPGDEEKTFRALPKPKKPDPETEYLRQRIAFRCGINRVRAGARQSKKYFQAAAPLLATQSQLRQELVDLVYANATSPEIISALAEAMESLARHVDDPDFLQAAGHCIGLDVENLLGQGISPTSLEKRLAVGFQISPDCMQLQTISQLVHRDKNFQRVDKAMRGYNLAKAARIVAESEDEELEGIFFATIEKMYDRLLSHADTELLAVGLHEMHEASLIVDEYHWLTARIEDKLRELEI
uniref:Tetratricopeptide repeat-containing protein n=1 Tax=Candidatus Kentrum sp. DK TaxID=2126562 RepID=A0A450RUL1_9GAMM|nr:MAG: hypothetical protein BECKDK2373B_GA0170837_100310 [Candidatus Kentron sp. DK]